MTRDHGVATVVAAQSGDLQAQDALVAAYLPLVYNIVGRALDGHADVDDVVQDTMLRALANLPTLRIPESFRSWLVAIAMNEVRRHWHREQPAGLPAPGEREPADPGADFVGLTIVRMGLSGQRKETVEATRWLDADDRALLSLWWLEAAGELTRAEVATALELAPEHTAVRVQRMKSQLEAARVVVRALAAVPLCGQLREVLGPWDGTPSALWRKRISRHAKDCATCSGHRAGLVPAEGLLAGFGLVPVAGVLVELVSLAVRNGGGPAAAGAHDAYGVSYATDAAAHTQPIPAGAPYPHADAHFPEGPGTAPYADATSLPRPGHTPGAEPLVGAGAGASGPGGDLGRRTSGGTADGDGPSRSDRRRTRQRRRQVVVAVAVLAVVGGGIGAVQWFAGGDDAAAGTSVADAARTGGPVLPGTDADADTRATPSTAPSSAVPSPTTASPTRSATPGRTPDRTPTPTKSKAAPPPAKPTRAAEPTRPAPPPAPPAPPAGPAQEVIALVNSERAKAGCGPVKGNTLLRTAAQRHSEDMIARGYFDHTSPDGDGPGERVTAAGYKWSTYGENIAAGQKNPAAVMDTWMKSPGHRANILNCAFKELGVGIADASGGIRWTQVFGAR
ncbi:sigma-70 family RNA polymerase sigma factor [Streptomyces sp. CA-294286]|uniref:sigma-70 family RNA polymerase sigma factor n=1 Tax=Streptomyces sp. CA-294286 TaxID=3240070 RepID=UPI003D942E86